jgi:hypothetical protein
VKPERDEFVEYYKDHTRKETAEHFGISVGIVKARAKCYGCGKDIRKPRPDEEEFKQLYQKQSTSQLATYYNVPERRIQHWAKTWNIHKPIKKVSEEELVSFYSTHTLSETAEHFDVSISYIVQLARNYGFKKDAEMISLSNQRSSKTGKPTTLPEDIPAFVEYFLKHSYHDTAIHYGVCKNTVARWRHELGIPDKSPDQWLEYRVMPSRAFDLPDCEEFEKIYNERSNEGAAQYFDVSRATIDRWREMLGTSRKANRWKDYNDETFTDRQKSIVLGSLLGDGGLIKVSSTSHSRFTETHGEEQQEYLRWKYEELLPFSSSFNQRVGAGKIRMPDGKVIEDFTKESIGYALNTMSHPIFTDLEKQWYARDAFGNYILDDKGWRIKIVPPELELDELMVAIWYFDDGSHNRTTGSGAVFNTQGFTCDECQLLCDKLSDMGFVSYLSTNRGMPIIRLIAKSYLPFIQMVSKYLPHECLRHKVDISNYNFDKIEVSRIPKQVAEKIHNMLHDGYTDEEISDLLDVSKLAVRDIRLSRTWSKMTGGEKLLITNYLTETQILEIRNLAASGMSDEEIGMMYHRKPKYIQSIRLGVKRKLVGGRLTSHRK